MRKAVVLVAMAALQGHCPLAAAADWTLEPSISARESYTDNVFLSSNKEGDLITDISPSIGLRARGNRLTLDAAYSLQTLTYLNNSSQSTIRNYLNSFATLEALDDFFFVDADASISQQSVSPFGPSASNNGSLSSNQYEARTFGVSPYVRGKFASGLSYDARYRASWSTSDSAALSSSETTQATGNITSPIRLFGWKAEYNQSKTDFQNQQRASYDTTIYRGRLFFQPVSTLRLQAIGGYEENNYGISDQSGNTYGAGFSWAPSPRNSIDAEWEERYFGPSYLVNAQHRTRMSVWSLNYSRNITTTPEELLRLPAGNIAAFLNQTLTPKLPNEAQRIAAIQDFLFTTGLSPFLANSRSFYSEQVFLQERLTASATLLGRRNLVSFTLFWLDSESVSPSLNIPLVDIFATNNRFKQQGAALGWNHRFSGQMAFDSVLSRTYTERLEPATGDSVEDGLRLTLTQTLSPKTTATAGLGFSKFTSDSTGFSNYDAATIFIGANHRF
jgi:uncharacterized protein (PEP-CTERM system associated)